MPIGMNFDECVRQLDQKISLGINRSLDRVVLALGLLGNPHTQFKSIHIGGTNGKGSTSAMVASVLNTAGYRVGLTISPHLLSVCERIQINGEPISKDDFVEQYLTIESLCHQIPLTYFEFLIVMAFNFFAQKKVDFAVVEVGLGGRLDATNVVQAVSGGITNVALDHQEFLGETLDDILEEKKQIAKKGMNFWTAIQDEHLAKSLKRHCQETGAIYHHIQDEFNIEQSSFCFKNEAIKITPSLPGQHQIQNAAMACGIVNSLAAAGCEVSIEHYVEGIERTMWPARLERIYGTPNILIDGAHNAAGIESLAQYLREQKLTGPLVFGCLQNRDLLSLLNPLLPYVRERLFLCSFGHEKSYLKETLVELKKQVENEGNLMVEVLKLNQKTWYSLLRSVKSQETLIVAGSLYMAAQIKNFPGGDT